MSAEKWRPTEVAGTDLAVRVWTHERNVTLEVTETSELGDAFTIGHLTPGQAVRLSRALVAAAAEALGTSVEMPRRTKAEMQASIRAHAATLPKGPL